MKLKKLLFLFLWCCTTFVFAHQNIILKSIYHHRGVSQCDAPHSNQLELGTVVFYFSAKPVIKRVSSQKISRTITKNTYTMTGVQLQKEKMPALPIITKQYRVDMHAVGNDLHLVITYNPRAVAVVFDTFDSISLQKGLAIHFVDCNVAQQVVLQKSQKKKNNSKKIVVIDCGHGGSDAGAIGCFGIKEKDIVLSVGLRVAQLLQKAGMQVLLTRSDDTFVPLDERTSFANNHNADLFISLHANYAQNVSAQGIDTFCMHAPLLHREDQLSDGVCSSVLDAVIKARADESNKLARAVHELVITNVKNKYPTAVDRKVKHEVAQILLGSRMPAVLIELGFVSHEEEVKRLRDYSYQNLLAQSISSGIIAYLKE